MVVAAGLPVGLGSPKVGLHLGESGIHQLLVLQLCSFGRQGFDFCLVDDVLCQALASQWTGGLVLCWATALPLGCVSLALANDLGVLAGDDVPKVGHRPVGDFDCLPIQGLVARVAGGEALVQDLEELSANVGDDRFAKGRIEPADLTLSLFPPSHLLLPRLELQLLSVASPLQLLLVHPLGGVKHLLAR